jgi:tetratricopeptide (TPR) repeat protein
VVAEQGQPEPIWYDHQVTGTDDVPEPGASSHAGREASTDPFDRVAGLPSELGFGLVSAPALAAERARVHAALFGSPESPGGLDTASRSFGRYEVVRKLGEGAMGEVFLAVDPLLRREVAIKCVHPRLAGERDRGVGRLLQEARSMARLDHPHVVRVFEAGTDDLQAWIAMEYVDGANLRHWLADAQRSADEILGCLVAAGRGLAAAHAAGLVHRDFKPDNVLVDRQGRARVGDFGLVRALLDQQPSSPTSDRATAAGAAGSGSLTRDGAIVGTPAYMPPEQLAGDPVDATGDQFAFCVTVWEALFGVRPFGGHDPMELCAAILAGNLRKHRAKRVRIRRGIERALRRGLSARSADRFPSMSELLRRLEPRGVGRPAVVGGLLAAGAVSALFWVPAEAQRCDRAAGDAATAGMWDASRMAAVATAIERSRLPYRAAAASRVASAFDERLASWVTVWQGACAAAGTGVESQAQIDRKIACLNARRAETTAMLRQIESGDPRVVAIAQDAVERLPAPGSCESLDAEVAPVADEIAAVIDPLLASGRAMRLSGQPAVALGLLQLAEIEGVRAGAPSAAAEAVLELGSAQRELGDVPGAVATWHRAIDLGVAAGDERLQANAWFTLTQAAANDLRDADRAREWVQHGIAVAGRMSHAMSLAVRGELAAAQVLSIDAPADAIRAIEALLSRHGRDAEIDLEVRGYLDEAARHRAPLLLDLGRWEDAAAEYRRRIATDMAKYGEGHPRVADAWLGLGIALDRSGAIDGDDGAEAAYRRARDIYAGAWPSGHRDIAGVDIALANVAQRRGDLEAAMGHADTAMAMYRRVLRADGDVAFGEAWTVIGVIAHRRGEFAEAARAHDRARRVYEATSGEASANAAIARSNAAEARLMDEQPGHDLEQLRGEFEHAHQTLRRALGDDSPYLGYPEKGLGVIAMRQGDAEAARRWLASAARLCAVDEGECALVRVAEAEAAAGRVRSADR